MYNYFKSSNFQQYLILSKALDSSAKVQIRNSIWIKFIFDDTFFWISKFSKCIIRHISISTSIKLAIVFIHYLQGDIVSLFICTWWVIVLCNLLYEPVGQYCQYKHILCMFFQNVVATKSNQKCK